MEGFRGLAILLVFFVHFDALFQDYLAADSAARGALRVLGEVGNAGVDLFFVVSGYLIYGAVIQKPVRYGSFMKRRFERIYPTFAAVFAIYLALSFLFPAKSKIPGGFWPGSRYVVENLLLLPGIFDIEAMITPAWSLSYEFFYYLTIPLLVALLALRTWRPRARILFFLGFATAYVAFCFLVAARLDRLVMFVAGILLHETMNATTLPRRLTPALEWSAIAFVALSFVPISLIYERHESVSWLPGFASASTTHGVLWMFASFWILALFCFAFNGILNRIFRWTPMRWLGNISYSYYLIHGLTLVALSQVCHRVLPPRGHSPALVVAFLGLGFAATVVTATILFVLVEKPYSLAPKKASSGRRPIPRPEAAWPQVEVQRPVPPHLQPGAALADTESAREVPLSERASGAAGGA
jgi:peptidoglycan/LPS O-acetylase OafA/YrhL